MESLDNILHSFAPISLSEMDRVELMNRKETKFVFSALRLPEILQMASKYYQVLEIDNIRSFLYHTTYLDTCDLKFYMHQFNGRLNRFKVRYRVYESTGGSFLEIKHKTNKMRTVKWRIKNAIDKDTVFDTQAADFVDKYIGENKSLKPVLDNWFNRVTLVGIGFNERVTLDFNMSFAEIEGKKIELPYLAIAEMKYEKTANSSPFFKLLKDLQIRPSGFSKYCMGNILVNNTKKINTFKSKLLTLNKIKNDYSHSAIA
jgi:hypothetical protein